MKKKIRYFIIIFVLLFMVTGCKNGETTRGIRHAGFIINSEEFDCSEFMPRDEEDTNYARIWYYNGTKLITGHVEKFVPNSNFIGVMTEEEQKDYFESIKDKLIEKGLRRITDDVSKNSALNALLGISSYYEDELKQYQQRAGKHK